MDSRYKKSDVVRVFEYYNDMIVKSSYVGIILGCHQWSATGAFANRKYYVYDILSLEDRSVYTAEEFAIRSTGEEIA
jgi:hypothetical protein